jgi:hypothetical protein
VLAIETRKENWTRFKVVNGIQGKNQGSVSVVDHLKEKPTTITDLNLLSLLSNLTLLNLLPVNQLQANLLPMNPLPMSPLPTNLLSMDPLSTNPFQIKDDVHVKQNGHT